MLPDTLSDDIVRRIKKRCECKRLSINALLRRAGLSPHLIDDWKNRKAEPSVAALEKICRELDMDLGDLFANSEHTYTETQRRILEDWRTLSEEEKTAIFKYIEAMRELSGK